MNVNIVWGAPASGKSTYVLKRMEKGDLIVDLDLIKYAISLQPKAADMVGLLPLAFKIRNLIVEEIAKRTVYCENAWIVATLPDNAEREFLAKELNARVVHIDTPKDECIKRALADNA